MTTLRDTARQIGSAWTPAHTTAVIVLAALAIGFLPFVKMGLVVNGIFLGAIIALGAIGLTLIYGILNFANIAHGDYMTLGAYARCSLSAACFRRLELRARVWGHSHSATLCSLPCR